MKESRKRTILETITNFYLSSGDFNGIPIHDLARKQDIAWEDFVDYLSDLIENERVGAVFERIRKWSLHLLYDRRPAG